MAADQAPAVVQPAAAGISAHARARTHRITVIFAFLSIYLIWGSTYLAIRYAVATIPPLYTAGIRHLTAGLILLAWCAWKRLRPTPAQWRDCHTGWRDILGGRNCIFAVVETFGATAAAVGAFTAERLHHVAYRWNNCGRMAAILAPLCIESLLGRAGLPDRVRVSSGVYRVQLAARALLPYTGGHAHVRKSNRGGAAWLDLSRRGRDPECAPWRGDGGGRRHAGGPRDGSAAIPLKNPPLILSRIHT